LENTKKQFCHEPETHIQTAYDKLSNTSLSPLWHLQVVALGGRTNIVQPTLDLAINNYAKG